MQHLPVISSSDAQFLTNLFRLFFFQIFQPRAERAERRAERAWVARYEAALERVVAGLHAGNHALAQEWLGATDTIKGFGHVKARHQAAALSRWAVLAERWSADPAPKP